ncbi:CHASE3 domain-containing protein [Flavobacterium kingsejongi]|uniref:histidine kinase n=1 Tax=Flavobacterium kingsejongi TaxID=1678728 RepID=A0A2S1LNW3_9FLAO|nr:CHASE3 domain-containing protein [Flavobacterium kingsejongi]AWG25424.1 hypothetical protein FK004_09345 [Flavobacterium kingsejongi]
MTKLSLKSKVDFIFIIIIGIFAILVYSTRNQSQLARDSRMIVHHTSSINTVLEKILSSTIDLETGSRGYTITGNENYLEVYNQGHKNLEIWLDSLRAMNELNRGQVLKLDTLERLIESKKQISALTIKTRKESGMDAAAAITKAGRGKEIMDSIRKSVAAYQNQSVKLLSANLNQSEVHVKSRNWNFTLFAICTFAILFFAYLQIRKNTERLILEKIIQTNLMTELTVQNQQLNDFANITIHDLRSPAGNITSLVATMEQDSTLEEYKVIFSMLRKVAQNLNESLNQLIEVLHLKKNKIIQQELLVFQDCYSRTIESLQGEILKSNALIKADFSQINSIMYSKIYLESIFQNLISNALKYRDPNRRPEITIHTEITKQTILLHVSDNGLGIDMSKNGSKLFGMKQIFHNHPEAKGIGLFIVKTQIENMKGRISVQS